MADTTMPKQNQILLQAIEALQKEDTPQNRARVLGAVLDAKFVCPVVLTPEPPRNEKGKAIMQPDTKIGLKLLESPENKRFFMAFTCGESFAAWNKEKKNHDVVVNGFDQFAGLLIADKNVVEGVVIDPMSANLTLPKDLIIQLKRQKDRNQGLYSIAKTDRLVFEDVKKPNEEKMSALNAWCKKKPEVNAAFLRMMFHNGNKNYLLVLDLKEGTEHKPLFDEVSTIAKPHLKNMMLGVTRIQDSLGKKGIENAKPFYKKLFYKIPDLK